MTKRINWKKYFGIRQHYYYRVDKTRPFAFPNAELHVKTVTKENYKDIQKRYPKRVPLFYSFLENGNKGFYGYINGRLVAYGWAILNKQNRSKKVRGFFPLPGNAACIHFCRVMDDFQGKKIYQTMLAYMYKELYQEVNDIYLDTEITNQAANQAVNKSNGEIVGRLIRFVFLGRTLLTFKQINKW